MRLLLAKIVQQDLDAEVTLAGTCEAALRFARANTYDAIVLDLVMPGMGGTEVLKQIRDDSACQFAPVIIVSVLSKAPETRTLDAEAVLSKPVDRDSLVAALKAQIGAARQRNASPA